MSESRGPVHRLEKEEHPREDEEQGGLQQCTELLVVGGEAKEISELSLTDGSDKLLRTYI